MNRPIYFLALFFIISQPLFAQESGVPLALDVSNRPRPCSRSIFPRTTMNSSFIRSKRMKPIITATFNFVVTGAFGASKPPVFYTNRPEHRAIPTDRDRLEYQLRQADRAIARRLQQTGGYKPVATKTAVQQQIGSTRQYVFSFGRSEDDTTITATLVATSAHAHGYLDIADTGKLHTARIQSHLDHFSTEAYPIATSIFGEESDVDNDGKVHFLYTSMVDNAGSGTTDVHAIQSGDGEYPSHNVSGIAGFYTIRSVLPQNRGGNGNMADLMYLSPTISSQVFTNPCSRMNFNTSSVVINMYSCETAAAKTPGSTRPCPMYAKI